MTTTAMDLQPQWKPLVVPGGALALLMSVVMVQNAALAALLIVLTVGTLGCMLWSDARISPPQPWPHLICVLLSLVSMLGLCASHCGSYASYASLLSFPTALLGAMMHGGIALVLMASARGHAFARAIAPQLVSLAAGGSLFYLLILISGASWCGACVAIHAMMLAQCVAMLSVGTWGRRLGLVIWLLSATGGINAVYHHRLVAARDNDADRLLSYLRSAWSMDTPAQCIEPMSQDISSAIRAGTELRARLRALHDHSLEPASVTSGSLTSAGPTHPPRRIETLRAVSDANRWGSALAPVTLLVGIDSGCPVCAQEFGQLLELHDLVEQHELQVRFLLSYRTLTAQAMASLSYAGGLLGDQQLLSCLGQFYQHQQEILLPADAVSVLPKSVPAVTAIGILRHQHELISALLADAENLKQHLGATGDPTLWLESSGHSVPERTFHGLTMSAIVRLAIISLEPANMVPKLGTQAGVETPLQVAKDAAPAVTITALDLPEDPVMPAASASP